MANKIENDLISKYMDNSELITTLGWNSVKGLVTAIILTLGFLKFMDLIGYGITPILHVIAYLFISLAVYYQYYWKASYNNEPKTYPSYTMGNTFENRNNPRNWTDFFYTTKSDIDISLYLLSSWFIGALAYAGLMAIAYIAAYCLDNTDSPIVMTVTRITILGIIASSTYLYTQRYEMRKNLWKTIRDCIISGFMLSIGAYALGFAIGVSGLVFGMPITITVIILEIGFTALYTYMDLVTWSKNTHIRLVKEEEEAKLKLEEEKKKAETEKEPIVEQA